MAFTKEQLKELFKTYAVSLNEQGIDVLKDPLGIALSDIMKTTKKGDDVTEKVQELSVNFPDTIKTGGDNTFNISSPESNKNEPNEPKTNFLKDFAAGIKNKEEETLARREEIADKEQGILGNTLTNMGEAINGVTDSISGHTDEILGDVKSDLIDPIKNAGSSIIDSTSKMFGIGEKSPEEETNTILGSIANGIDGLGNVFLSGTKGVEDSIDDLKESIQTEADEADKEAARKTKDKESGGIFGGLLGGGFGGILLGLSGFLKGLIFLSTGLLGLGGLIAVAGVMTGQIKVDDIIAGFKDIYQQILPSLKLLGDAFKDVLTEILPVFKDMLSTLIPILTQIVKESVPMIVSLIKSMAGLLTKALPLISTSVKIVAKSLPPIIGFLGIIADGLSTTLDFITSSEAQSLIAFPSMFMLFTQKWGNYTSLFGRSMEKLNSTGDLIGKGFTKLGGLSTKILDFFNKLKEPSKILESNAGGFIKKIASFKNFFVGVGEFLGHFGKLGRFFISIGNTFTSIITGPIKLLSKTFEFLPKIFGGFVGKLIAPVIMIKRMIDGLFDEGSIRDKILAASAGILSTITEIPQMIGNAILWLFGNDFRLDFGKDAIVNAINGITDWVYTNITEPISDFLSLDSLVTGGISEWMGDITDRIGNFFTETIPSWFAEIFQSLTDILPNPKNIFNDVMGFMSEKLSGIPLIGKYFKEEPVTNTIVPTNNIKNGVLGQNNGITSVPKLATGGVIQETGLIQAHAGEAIGPIDSIGDIFKLDKKNEIHEMISGVPKVDTGVLEKLVNDRTEQNNINDLNKTEQNMIVEQRFNTSTLEKINDDIITQKANERERMVQATTTQNQLLERNSSTMEHGNMTIKQGLEKIFKDSKENNNSRDTFVERLITQNNKHVPDNIENIGVFLTNSNWI